MGQGRPRFSTRDRPWAVPASSSPPSSPTRWPDSTTRRRGAQHGRRLAGPRAGRQRSRLGARRPRLPAYPARPRPLRRPGRRPDQRPRPRPGTRRRARAGRRCRLGPAPHRGRTGRTRRGRAGRAAGRRPGQPDHRALGSAELRYRPSKAGYHGGAVAGRGDDPAAGVPAARRHRRPHRLGRRRGRRPAVVARRRRPADRGGPAGAGHPPPASHGAGPPSRAGTALFDVPDREPDTAPADERPRLRADRG